MTGSRSPSAVSDRGAVVFSCVGHFFNHLFEPAFFVVALVLPAAFGISYETALTLIVGGKVLFGVAAPLAGWLGDRWSTTGMMAIYFLGMGGAAIWAGFAGGPWEMAMALTLLGLFGSIYHPVGIAWLVRSATRRGKALGINGIFGSLGPAVAGIGAGLMIEISGWRSAFIVPGILVFLVGLTFVALIYRGAITDHRADIRPEPVPERRDTVRAYTVLALAMLCGGLVYQSTQAALPKLFDERLDGLFGGGTLGPGTAVMLVYGFSALMQVFAGHLADRYSLKTVYLTFWLLQAPMLGAVAALSGIPLIGAAMLMVMLNTGALPAENMLLAKYTPPQWRATAYGFKFVVGFGVASLGIPLVGLLRATTGDFAWLFGLLAGVAVLMAAAALRLPQDTRPAPVPVPAE